MSKSSTGGNLMDIIRVTSLSFYNKPDEQVWEAVNTAGLMKSDLIILPETWAGSQAIETFDSARVRKLCELAKQYKSYIVSGMYRQTEDNGRINSAILIGRSGEIEGVYDKMYPYWEEFDLTPPVQIGKEPMVFDTDFGKLGIAICFDANIPAYWQRLAELGAQVVAWPSAYSGGSYLQAHAINHHYYVVSATHKSDCVVYDITGKEILCNVAIEDDSILISSIELDLDRCIFHRDFTVAKKRALLTAHAGDLIEEQSLPKEGWFVLKSVKENVSVRKLAREYGLEELPAYKLRSIKEMDSMRGANNV